MVSSRFIFAEFHAPRRRVLISTASAFVLAFLCGSSVVLAGRPLINPAAQGFDFLPGFSALQSVLTFLACALLSCGYAFVLVAANLPKPQQA
jgi:hypothetical protein